MRILIISYFFPPYNNIGAVRVGKLAEYWLRAGHDVRIVTAADQPTPANLSMDLPEDRITYTAWINVNWLPEMMLGGRGRVASQGFTTNKSFLAKLGFLYKTIFNFPDGQIGWWPFGYKAADKLIQDGWHPDFIYASAKPAAPLLIARKLAAKYGIPWVAEFRDLWTDDHNYSYPEFRRRIERSIEKSLLASASALVTVSESLAEKLRRKYSQPVAVITNGFDPEDYCDPPITGLGPHADDTLNIIYTGMIYSGKQDITPLFSALAKLRDPNKVHVYFYGRYLNELTQLASQYGVEHMITVLPAIPHKQAIQMQMQADILLLLLWNDPAERGIYTGKLFEYFGARHPILAIGAHRDAASELIQERKAGTISNDPDEIAEQLKAWIERKESNKAGFTLPKEASIGLTRMDQFAKLDIFLKQHGLLNKRT